MGKLLLDLGYHLGRFFGALRGDPGSNLHLTTLEIKSLNRQPSRQSLESFDDNSLVGGFEKALGIADDGQEKVLPRRAPPENAPADDEDRDDDHGNRGKQSVLGAEREPHPDA